MPSPAVAPIADASRAPAMIAFTTSFLVLAIISYAARMYCRVRLLRNVWWDDYIISVAMVLAIVEWALLMAAVKHGIGRHTFHVPPGDMDKAGIFIIFTLVVWCWAVTLVKVSMAMMLLRIQRTKVWQWGLGIVIAIQILAVIANTLVNFIQCHPLSATWNPRTPKATCWDPSQKASVAYILSAIFITSDILLSCLPITFIWKIHRPVREKVVLVVLMALGLFASAAAIVKVVLLTQKTTAQDPFWAAGNLFIWTNIEECLGIAAACIPNFRALFEKLLVHFGLTSIGTGERRSARGASWQIANNSSNHLNSFRMSTNRDSNHTKAKRAYGNASEEIILALKAHNLYLSDEMSGQNEVETSETTISFTKV